MLDRGPPALDAVLAGLNADFPWPVLIAQHMPASFTGPLARRLDRLCRITVREVDRPMPLIAGHAYIGRGDADLILSRRNGRLMAMPAPLSSDHIWHPAWTEWWTARCVSLHPKHCLAC
jgi:two-component system chemotaxis response regulator CheB